MPRRGRFRLHRVEIKGKGERRSASFIVAKENAAAKNFHSIGRNAPFIRCDRLGVAESISLDCNTFSKGRASARIPPDSGMFAIGS